jgi:hypothetical protein
MGTVMARLALMMAGVAMVVGIGVTAVAGSPVPEAAAHVKPGGVWTSEPDGNGCEVQTFAAGHTWTGDGFGDSGTYTGGGKKITTTDTAGNDVTLVFTGSYSKAKKQYTGTFAGRDGITAKGQLVKGAVSTWNGYSC